MKIRKGNEKDIPQLWQIEIESAKYHQKIIPKKYQKFEENAVEEISKKLFIKNFKKNMEDKDSFFLVAEKDKKIVGYLSVDLVYSGASKPIKCPHIVELGILKRYSRRGTATKLIKQLEKISKDKKYKFISLNVKSKNIPAIKLYQKNKFDIYDMQLLKNLK